MQDSYKTQILFDKDINSRNFGTSAYTMYIKEEPIRELNGQDLQSRIEELILFFRKEFNLFKETNDLSLQPKILSNLNEMNKLLRFFIKINPNSRVPFIGFPYEELFNLFVLFESDDLKQQIVMSCISKSSSIDLNFQSASISDQYFDILLPLVSSISPETPFFPEFILFLKNLIINSQPSLCPFLIPALFDLIDHSLAFQIQDSLLKILIELFNIIIQFSSESFSETLLLFCIGFISMVDDNSELILNCFQCFSSFIQQFDLDLISQDIALLLIQKGLKYSTSNEILICFLLFPLNLLNMPNDYFDNILNAIANPFHTNHFNCLNFLIHFQSSYENFINNEFLFTCLLFGAQVKEFSISLKFTECCFCYHLPENTSIDIQVFQLCLKFIETSLFLNCVRKMRQIIDYYAMRKQEQLHAFLDLLESDVIDSIQFCAIDQEITNEEHEEMMADMEYFNNLLS